MGGFATWWSGAIVLQDAARSDRAVWIYVVLGLSLLFEACQFVSGLRLCKRVTQLARGLASVHHPKENAGSGDAWQEGQRIARRRTEAVREAAKRGDAAWAREHIEPVTHPDLERAEIRPQQIVLLSLGFTIAGLAVALLILGSGLAANNDPKAGVAGFGHLWQVFIPTAFGVALSWLLAEKVSRVQALWHRNANQLEDDLRELFSRESRSAAVEAVGESLAEASQTFAGAVAQGTKQIENACGSLDNAVGRLAVQVEEIGTSAAQVHDANEQLALSRESLVEAAHGLVTALEPTRQAAETLGTSLDSLNDASQRVRQAVDMLQSVFTESAATSLNQAAEGLVRTSGGFERLLEDLDRRDSALAERLQVIVDEARRVTQQAADATVAAREAIERTVQDGQQANVQLVEEITGLVQRSPDHLIEVAEAATRVAESVEGLRQLRGELEAGIGQQLSEVHAAVAQLRQLVDGITESLGRTSQEMLTAVTGLSQQFPVEGLRTAVEQLNRVVASQDQEMTRVLKGFLTALSKQVDRIQRAVSAVHAERGPAGPSRWQQVMTALTPALLLVIAGLLVWQQFTRPVSPAVVTAAPAATAPAVRSGDAPTGTAVSRAEAGGAPAPGVASSDAAPAPAPTGDTATPAQPSTDAGPPPAPTGDAETPARPGG